MLFEQMFTLTRTPYLRHLRLKPRKDKNLFTNTSIIILRHLFLNAMATLNPHKMNELNSAIWSTMITFKSKKSNIQLISSPWRLKATFQISAEIKSNFK